jgi:hypothetical protein
MSPIKEPPLGPVFQKNQNQRTSGSVFFKNINSQKNPPSSSFSLNIKEPTSFMKYPDKNRKFHRKQIDS